MIRNRSTPLLTSLVLAALGLALGAGRSENDASAANTASEVLLTLGMVGVVVTLVVMAVGCLRTRRATVPPDGGGSGR